MVGDQGKIDHDAYRRKIAELDVYLADGSGAETGLPLEL